MLQAELQRSKSSLLMKGEMVTHQLDCAVAELAGSAFSFDLAAVSASCRACALAPSVSQITKYLVKASRGGGDVEGVGAWRKRCAAIQPGKASTSRTRLASSASKSASLIPATGSTKSSMTYRLGRGVLLSETSGMNGFLPSGRV